MSDIEIVNKFLKETPFTNKKTEVVRTFTEGNQVYYIASVDGKVVSECELNEGLAESQLNKSLQEMEKRPVFITPNIKSYVTYSER